MDAPQSIRADELLPLKELRRRLNWGEHAVRQARVAGLKLVEFGREKYVLGADVLEEAFGHPVLVDRHPDTGRPRVTPRLIGPDPERHEGS